jgi:hypothetical protein
MMAGKQMRGGGVGRGNGAGSAKTQFKAGMPSGNRLGRPRKAKAAASASLKEAALKSLAQLIHTTENGITRKRPQSEAMIMLLLTKYPTAKPREMIAILRYVSELAPETELVRNGDLPKNAIKNLVERLAQEAKETGWE